MKILKLKSIFFSLMAIAMVTVFLTSCEREIIGADEAEFRTNIVENEFNEDNDHLKTLAQNLSESIDFQKIYKIDLDIFKRLETIVSGNDFSEIAEKLEYDNVKHIFDEYESELVSSLEKLNRQYPELGNLKEDQLKKVYQATNIIINGITEGNVVNKAKDCQQDCHDLYRSQNAYEKLCYRINRNNCISLGGSWSYCNNWAYQIYTNETAENYDDYIECFDDC